MTILPKRQPDFLAQMEMKEVQEALSLQLDKQRHKEFAKHISKFIESIRR